MTVLSKSGASTDSPAGDSSSSYPQDDKRQFQEPPSYTDSVGEHNIQSSTNNNAAPSASSSTAAPLPPARNYVHEDRGNGSIKGTWVIDTNIEAPPPPPPSFWSSLGWSPKEPLNLSLTTRNGEIKANVVLTSGSPKRASIKVHTNNGAVTVKIPSRVNNQPINLVATTNMGAIKVGLPRSFVGPFNFQTNWGNIKYSDDLRAKANTYSPKTGFIGDWRDVGFVDHQTWTGDSLDVRTNMGQISFFYADEMPEHVETGSNGFWKAVTDWFGPRQ